MSIGIGWYSLEFIPTAIPNRSKQYRHHVDTLFFEHWYRLVLLGIVPKAIFFIPSKYSFHADTKYFKHWYSLVLIGTMYQLKLCN